MDFYNFGETGYSAVGAHQQISHDDVRTPEYQSYLKEYLKAYVFGSRGQKRTDSQKQAHKLNRSRRVLVIEDETRIRKVLQSLIQEEYPSAVCEFADSVDEFERLHAKNPFDSVIVNYYQAEDEIEYEFWDQVREQHPDLEVIFMSHVNDRDYYEMLERLAPVESVERSSLVAGKLKTFFENFLGGRHGNY